MVYSNGGTWFIEWHPTATEPPEGTRHGANAFCACRSTASEEERLGRTFIGLCRKSDSKAN